MYSFEREILYHKAHEVVSQRTQSVELTTLLLSFVMIYAKFTENTKRDGSTLRLVSFVVKKSCVSIHKVARKKCGAYDPAYFRVFANA